MAEKNPVSVTIKCQADGFGFDLNAELLVEHIPGLLTKLREAGVTPANSPYVWEGQPADRTAGGSAPSAPICPVHGTPMLPSKKGNGFYCPKKLDDGSYCKAKAVA